MFIHFGFTLTRTFLVKNMFKGSSEDTMRLKFESFSALIPSLFCSVSLLSSSEGIVGVQKKCAIFSAFIVND